MRVGKKQQRTVGARSLGMSRPAEPSRVMAVGAQGDDLLPLRMQARNARRVTESLAAG